MRRSIPYVALAVALALLPGCASSTRESEWRCNAQRGLGCVTVAQADAVASKPTSAGTAITDFAAAEAHKSDPNPFLDMLRRVVGPRAEQASDQITVGAFRRVPELLARVWVAPWIDAQGNVNEGGYVWTVIKPAQWVEDKVS